MSFFEKLKRGMGAEGAPENEVEQKDAEVKGEKPAEKVKKPRAKKEKEEPFDATSTFAKASADKQDKEEKTETKEKPDKKDNWSQFSQSGEGQLAIDVYQTDDFLVIQSAIAGVKPESLDVVIEGDMVSIKGVREKPEETGERNYFYQECFWGPFSRQIVLSVEVDPGRTEANLKDGILTVRVPKIERERKRKIEVRG